MPKQSAARTAPALESFGGVSRMHGEYQGRKDGMHKGDMMKKDEMKK